MAGLMDRYVGLEWEQRYDALEAIRAQQRAVIEEPPHGTAIDEEGQKWPFWCGARQTDENSAAIGYYVPFPQEDGTLEVQFRPIGQGLSRDYAENMSRAYATALQKHPDNQFSLYVSTVKSTLEEDRQAPTPPADDIEIEYDTWGLDL